MSERTNSIQQKYLPSRKRPWARYGFRMDETIGAGRSAYMDVQLKGPDDELEEKAPIPITTDAKPKLHMVGAKAPKRRTPPQLVGLKQQERKPSCRKVERFMDRSDKSCNQQSIRLKQGIKWTGQLHMREQFDHYTRKATLVNADRGWDAMEPHKSLKQF
ncbi:uncharacterized protein PITG_14263 [Phytophthora infestans T30-4]|uniref:Uncharacterized protein n=1 Tax=Phytophthora infestans (strain T30-4) TaxID=403677 RepID=D0NNZ7_PHYIT|nr:uncharacterized protein PITG_14263 [Phytophthora infestans T30-4]EEY62318.1 hypothetical protein PITG_14263 [Phytophthora infestans T30-4]|eukprot:XP_002899349.1 hypothetical protein PITG_14263 [Phytophthora infestans T30-4]